MVVKSWTRRWYSWICDLITEMFFRAPGPRIKYFERIFCRSLNKKNISIAVENNVVLEIKLLGV